MHRKFGRWFYIIGGLFGCIFLALITFFYLDYISARAMPTVPQVSIDDTYPEGTATVNQSVIVFGQAKDPDGIVVVQLWVSGKMVASQKNQDQGSALPFDVSQAWVPTGAGHYLVLLRALDSKGTAGQSDPVMVDVSERSYTYEVKDGETVEKIAENLDTTPQEIQDLNPGIGDSPPAGTNLDVPGLPAGSESGEGGETPRVDPPPAPVPPSGEEAPAEPASPEYWRYFLPGNFVCLIIPDTCRSSPTDETLSPPINVGATLNDSCQVLVGWQDTTEGEMGFRVYRVARRPFHYDLVTLRRASPGTGARLSYLDETPPNQDFFYFVAAYNARGEFWSAPTELISVGCRTRTHGDLVLNVEALEMTVRDSYDRLYCYASLADLPFERIPSGSSFIEMEGGVWNIAEHFGGENSRRVLNNSSTPLDIVVECMGWQGDTLVNLGRFSRSHPPEEWDGRTLTAESADGSFTVAYRITTATLRRGGYGGGGEGADGYGGGGEGTDVVVDPSYPPPYNLRAIEPWRRCSDPGGGVVCTNVQEPGLTWQYDLRAGWRHTFRVYARRASEMDASLFYESFRGFTYAPQMAEACNTVVYYHVSAVVGIDPVTGATIESLPSEELEVRTPCSQLEITLLSLQAFSAPDGDPGTDLCFNDCGASVEAYGWLNFNGHVLKWNNHEGCDSFDGCIAGPGFTPISPGLYSWADMSLGSVRSSGFGRNVLRIPVEDGDRLSIAFDFWDHDYISPDDLWCGWDIGRTSGLHPRQNFFTMDSRSLSEWYALDQDVTVRPTTEYSTCEITFHIRGAP